MKSFKEWQQNNRKRFPNAAMFFDAFSKAHDEVLSDVIKGARDGAVCAVAGSVIQRKKLPLFALAFDAALGAGFAAGQHAVSAATALIKISRKPEQYDFSILSYDNAAPKEKLIFHHSLMEQVGGNKLALTEIGDSVLDFENNLLEVVEGKKKLSEVTMHAFEHSIINLPAKRLEVSLNEQLDKYQISHAEERARYHKMLAQILEEKAGLKGIDNHALNNEEKKRRALVEPILEEEPGLKERLHTINHSLKNIHSQAAMARLQKSQQNRQREMDNLRALSNSFQLMQSIGEVTHSTALQKAAVVGQSAYRIIAEISHLKGLMSIGSVGIGAFVGSIATIGIAGCMVMKLFKGKKESDNSQLLIMKQLQALSQQMAEFRQEVMQQFMQIHCHQRLIYEAVCQGFNLIYFSIKSETEDLKYAVISRLDDLQNHLSHLEQYHRDVFKELKTQSLLKSIFLIEKAYRRFEKEKVVKLDEHEIRKLLDTLTFWLISHNQIGAQCKSPLLSGASMLPYDDNFQQHDYKRALGLLKKDTAQLNHMLGFMTLYAERYLLKNTPHAEALSSFRQPLNLEIWVHVTNAYVKLRKMNNHAGFDYDHDQSELKKILEDAEHSLNMFKTIQKLGFQLFSGLIENYNRALTSLKLQLKVEVKRIVTQERMRLGEHTKLLLENVTANVHGTQITLKNASTDNLDIPKSLLIAHRLGLGQFVFDGSRSERTAGDIRRHSKHGLGVSLNCPSARYIIDVYFQFNHDEGNRISIASGEKNVPGYREDTNPGKREHAYIANANYMRGCNALNLWRNKANEQFFQDMWPDATGLSFKVVNEVFDETQFQQKLEASILRSNLSEILNRDAIKECHVQLSFFQKMIEAYRTMIGKVAEDFMNHFPQFRDAEEISSVLLRYFSEEGKTATLTSVEDVYQHVLPEIDIEISASNYEFNDDALPSPLTYPILEEITELSSHLPIENESSNIREAQSNEKASDKPAGFFKRKRTRSFHDEHEDYTLSEGGANKQDMDNTSDSMEMN